jgi:hypothetical protein
VFPKNVEMSGIGRREAGNARQLMCRAFFAAMSDLLQRGLGTPASGLPFCCMGLG